jgi:heat shock protein HslJ
MSAMVRTAGIAALAVLLAASAACSAGGAPRLDGTSWVLSAWSVSSVAADEFRITLTFTDGTLGGQAPVNSYGGEYTVGAEGRFATSEIASTLMAGSEEANRAEAAYFELLRRAERVAVEGATLTLSDANGNELLVFTAAE